MDLFFCCISSIIRLLDLHKELSLDSAEPKHPVLNWTFLASSDAKIKEQIQCVGKLISAIFCCVFLPKKGDSARVQIHFSRPCSVTVRQDYLQDRKNIIKYLQVSTRVSFIGFWSASHTGGADSVLAHVSSRNELKI